MRNLYLTIQSHITKQIQEGNFSRLAAEITLVLAIKVCLIWLLWFCFFSHPIAKNDRQQAVSRIILNQ